jgi:hypothetical protein
MGLQAQLPLRVALAGLDRQTGVEFSQRTIHRLHEKCSKSSLRTRSGPARLRYHHLDFIAFAHTSVEPIFGLTQIQSTPAGTGSVPLVSMAMVKPRVHGVDQRPSSCSSGSPPVNTTYLLAV